MKGKNEKKIAKTRKIEKKIAKKRKIEKKRKESRSHAKRRYAIKEEKEVGGFPKKSGGRTEEGCGRAEGCRGTEEARRP
jgi:hypothetical protein